jgi:membrane protease YdiL (CAAX protease family)
MKEGQWPKLIIGLAAIFAVFQWSAESLGSDRGEAGVAVGSIVVATALVAERLFFAKSSASAAFALGLGSPTLRGMLIACGISLMMLLTIPVFTMLTKSSFSFIPGWGWLVPGLFFQGGIGEETLFRGYLFGHIKKRYEYWKAAALAAIPFVAVHLILFLTLPWPIAVASILLAVAMSFPLSRLYELGGNTIWAPAILHFFAQGTIKVIALSGGSASAFPFFWITICALIPLCVYCFPSPTSSDKLNVSTAESFGR